MVSVAHATLCACSRMWYMCIVLCASRIILFCNERDCKNVHTQWLNALSLLDTLVRLFINNVQYVLACHSSIPINIHDSLVSRAFRVRRGLFECVMNWASERRTEIHQTEHEQSERKSIKANEIDEETSNIEDSLLEFALAWFVACALQRLKNRIHIHSSRAACSSDLPCFSLHRFCSASIHLDLVCLY